LALLALDLFLGRIEGRRLLGPRLLDLFIPGIKASKKCKRGKEEGREADGRGRRERDERGTWRRLGRTKRVQGGREAGRGRRERDEEGVKVEEAGWVGKGGREEAGHGRNKASSREGSPKRYILGRVGLGEGNHSFA
jgi:hypothetical protein